MEFDLAKDAACSIPCEFQRQLMFQNHPKLLAEITCNLTLFLSVSYIKTAKNGTLKFFHTEILMIVVKSENKNVYLIWQDQCV